MDGVLLDSEALYWKVNFEFFADLGVEITHEEYNSFIGISGTKMWTYIKDKGGLVQEIPDLIDEEKQRKYNALASTDLEPNTGLFELLDLLKDKHIPCCIASSGLMKNIELILSRLKVTSYFSHIVSGEMVTNGKPAPDIFLLASGKYGIQPEHCLVIEDSRNGVLAAKSAGMFCVGYVNEGSGTQDLSKADIISEKLNDPELLSLFH